MARKTDYCGLPMPSSPESQIIEPADVTAGSGEAVKGDGLASEIENLKGHGRRDAFLKAAREIFLEKGFESASMADIVKRAGGGSLSTMYDLFGSKDKLFEEVITARVNEFTSPMQLELLGHTPLREGLARIGEWVLRRLLEQDALEMFRLMAAQSKKFPETSAIFQIQGTDRIRGALTAYLEDRVAAGELKLSDADVAAQVFFDLIRYRMPIRAIMVADYRPGEAEIREAVQRAITVFLHGVEAL